MVIEVRIKLTSPILGELKADANGIRRFKKDAGRIGVNRQAWSSAIKDASGMAGLYVDPTTIIPPANYESPEIRLYRRTYNRMHVEMFEAIQKGTVLTLEFAVMDKIKAPTIEQAQIILATIGAYIGISQFGSKFGFGLFEVLSVTDKWIQKQESYGGQVNS